MHHSGAARDKIGTQHIIIHVKQCSKLETITKHKFDKVDEGVKSGYLLEGTWRVKGTPDHKHKYLRPTIPSSKLENDEYPYPLVHQQMYEYRILPEHFGRYAGGIPLPAGILFP